MTLVAFILSVLFGIALTVNDQMALRAMRQFSRRHGLVFWCLNVVLPCLFLLVFVPKHALVGMAVAIVLSVALRQWRRRKQQQMLSAGIAPAFCLPE